MSFLSHYDVTCDNCGVTGFHGLRFKCLRCEDFDLCQQCHDNNNSNTDTHGIDHPFQTLLDGPAMALFFTGERLPGRSADSFTCPICGDMGHDDEELLRHVVWSHRNSREPVICPICVAIPNRHPERTDNIACHLMQEHTTEVRFLAGLVPMSRGEPLPANAATTVTGSHGRAQPINDGSEELDQEVIDALYNNIDSIALGAGRGAGNGRILLPEFELLSNGPSSMDGRRNPIARGLDNNVNR